MESFDSNEGNIVFIPANYARICTWIEHRNSDNDEVRQTIDSEIGIKITSSKVSMSALRNNIL